MIRWIAKAALVMVSMASAVAFAAQERPRAVLFKDVRVFDGLSDTLTPPRDVLVEGKLITRISAGDIPVPEGGRVIDGGGHTLMPGLIDAHTHLMMSQMPPAALLTADIGYVNILSGRGATEMLMRGFTSARDLGGPVFGLKRAIDSGVIAGPRIWPSGATVSQTSGHGDFRIPSLDLPRGVTGDVHPSERFGFTVIADGEAEVLRAVREQLMRGASQIKLMAGGGVSSSFDPLDVVQYTEAEMRAAVEAAASWNTYVTVHAYTPDAIRQAIRAGVKVIDHGQLADEDTARLMAAEGVWWSIQPFLDDEDANPHPEGSPNRAKQIEMTSGTERAFELARKHKVKLAFGTDALFDPATARKQGKQLTKLTRWFTPAEVLRMATATNAELLALSGPRSPYPGRLGVVEEGALADLILVEGDPLADITLIARPETAFSVIMKDGVLYKDETGN